MSTTEKNVISNDLNQKFIAAFGEEQHRSTEGALRDSLNKAGVADNSMGNLVPLLLSFILHDTKPGANPDKSLKNVQKRLDDTRDGSMQTYGGWKLHQNPTASIYNTVKDMCVNLCVNIMSRDFGLQGNDPKFAANRWGDSVFPKPSPNSSTAQQTKKSDDDFDEKAAAAKYNQNNQSDRARAKVADAAAENFNDGFDAVKAVENYNDNKRSDLANAAAANHNNQSDSVRAKVADAAAENFNDGFNPVEAAAKYNDNKRSDFANAERAAGQPKGDPFDKIGSTVTEYMNSKPPAAAPAEAAKTATETVNTVTSAVSDAASNAAASVRSALSAFRPKP